MSRIMKEFIVLKPKMYNGHADKKAKSTEKYVIKREIKFQDYKDCWENEKVIFKSQQRFRTELHNVFIKRVNKIALSVNKRI